MVEVQMKLLLNVVFVILTSSALILVTWSEVKVEGSVRLNSVSSFETIIALSESLALTASSAAARLSNSSSADSVVPTSTNTRLRTLISLLRILMSGRGYAR